MFILETPLYKTNWDCAIKHTRAQESESDFYCSGQFFIKLNSGAIDSSPGAEIRIVFPSTLSPHP